MTLSAKTIKDMAESAEPEKTSLSDTGNRFHYSTTKKSDSFVVDMENLNQGATDMNANSRITVSFLILYFSYYLLLEFKHKHSVLQYFFFFGLIFN